MEKIPYLPDPQTANFIKDVRSFNTSDFSGAAHFFYDTEDYLAIKALKQEGYSAKVRPLIKETYLDIPMVLTSAQAQMADYHKLEPYIGDIYGIQYFGKSPVIFNFSANILNTIANSRTPDVKVNGYNDFKNLYTYYLRISKVAKHRRAPYLTFTGCTVRGAMLGLTRTMTTSTEDYVPVQFQFLALNIAYDSPENLGWQKAVKINFTTDRAEGFY